MRTLLGIALLTLGTLGACASAKDKEPPAKPAKEVVSGAARIKSSKFRMDVQVGRTFTQRPQSNTTLTAKPAAPVIK